MRWIALGLGTTAAVTALAWGLVTTGHWPLDERVQPAAAFYALNGALGRWLLDHGGETPEGTARGSAGPGGSGASGPAGLTPAELHAVQETLRTDPQFRDRHRFTPVPTVSRLALTDRAGLDQGDRAPVPWKRAKLERAA